MSCERDCVAMKDVRQTWHTTESAPFRCAMPAAPPPPLPSSAARFAACSRDLFALETFEPLPILFSRAAAERAAAGWGGGGRGRGRGVVMGEGAREATRAHGGF
jgi:hypothetical protein